MEIDCSELRGWIRLCQMAPKESVKAMQYAVNDAGNAARTQVVRTLGTQMGLPYATVRQSLTTIAASPSRLAYELHSAGGFLSLASFDVRQVRAGVSARPWGQRRIFRSAFIVRALGGEAFRRTTRARFPIRKLYGPAMPVEMVRDQVPAAFEQATAERLPKRLGYHLERLMPEKLEGVL